MHLDMLTISAVNVTVTLVLGLVLVFTWMRERTSALVGWWGLAQLVMAAGMLVSAVAASLGDHAVIVTVGAASMILAEALKMACGAQVRAPAGQSDLDRGWPVAFLLIADSGYVGTFDGRLILCCAIVAAYNLAAAIELARGKKEGLVSRIPAVILLAVAGIGYLSWLPLILKMPIGRAQLAFTREWFATVVLVAVALRVALAFIVLALAKERAQMQQRNEALTDSLTGLPNRRALIEAAGRLERRGAPAQDPISVLLFDLDHFKKINDAYGHRLGDHVLKLFAATLSQQIDGKSIIGRLGGEEFAAILPGVHPAVAVGVAESVRSAFEASATLVDGVAVRSTVSVGAASDASVGCDLGALFHRADAALYRAKNAGRNRVELVGPDSPAAETSPGQSAAEAAIIEYQRRLTA
jgi:diguanylate cyclase (GGDEF)-like protein